MLLRQRRNCLPTGRWIAVHVRAPTSCCTKPRPRQEYRSRIYIPVNCFYDVRMGLVVLTGASGSGKTAIAEAIASRYAGDVDVYHFDRAGVPPVEEMIAKYGSGEAWQRAMTFEWLARLAATPYTGRTILFEGQMRLSFVSQAAAAAGIRDYALVLVDCDDATRTKRLALDRRDQDLANPTMMAWARHLRDEAKQLRCTILDTSRAPFEVCIEQVWTLLNQ
jgi:hypothetical protein